MIDKSDPDIQALAAEIKNLREDFGRIGRVLEELVRNRGNAAAAEASRTAEHAWEEVSRTAQDTRKMLEQNPMATLAGAFGFGLLFGMLFSGRHR